MANLDASGLRELADLLERDAWINTAAALRELATRRDLDEQLVQVLRAVVDVKRLDATAAAELLKKLEAIRG